MPILGIVCIGIVITTSNALTCLNCPDIIHPRFCQHVRQCPSDEVCGLEKFVDSYGDVRYKLGCFLPAVCDRRKRLLNLNPPTSGSGTGHTNCFKCCTSDMCNTNGCGETDSFQHNSKVCYNCEGSLRGDVCRQISFCNTNEMCYMQEGTRQGEVFYNSGCIESHICMSITAPVIGRRDLETSYKRDIFKRSGQNLRCCQGHLCNKEYGSLPTQKPGSQNSHPTPTSNIFTQSPHISICQSGKQCYNGGNCQSSNCICPDGVFGDHCEYTDTRGTTFLLVFPQTQFPGCQSPQALIGTKQNGVFHKFSFSSHYNTSIQFSPKLYNIHFNRSVAMTSDGTFLHGVALSFSSKVSVYALTYCNKSTEKYSEGYMAIPTNFLSTKYIVPMYTSYSYNALIVVAAYKPNTIVNIHQKRNKAKYTFKNIVLSAYETYQISNSYDLSGTLITSTEPIAVVSGHEGNYIAGGGYNPFMEMILPSDQWDRVYVIPHIARRPSKIVRIYSNQPTNVTVHYQFKIESKSIPERSFVDFDHGMISYFNASNDVMVMVFPKGLADYSGDAFMMTVPGINQYLSVYEFAVPSEFTNYISITVLSNARDGFILDGNPMHHENGSHIFGGPNHYSTFTMPIHSGVHQISHTSNVRFGLWVYGDGPKDGYGYPAGIAFRTDTK
ncbi:uncharacterized protein LOC143048713 [Mytilus galloprovincialis]|uniref:uncharacterized protein LOC143048713 n=1 Tax=Mytilus galloprovincialis TaxID=29158 RepID=UPI003F7C8725